MYNISRIIYIIIRIVIFFVLAYIWYDIDSYPLLKKYITFDNIKSNLYFYTLGNPILLKARGFFFYFLNYIYMFINDSFDVNCDIDLHKNLLFEVNFILFIEIYFIIFIILYLLSLTIWTRAAGPRYRLDHLLSVAFRAILPTLVIVFIILSGIL